MREEGGITFGHGPITTMAQWLARTVKSARLEPAIVLHMFGFGLFQVEISNLYIEKTCRVGSYFFSGANTTYSPEVRMVRF